MNASLTQFRFRTFTALRILIIAIRRNRNRITKTTNIYSQATFDGADGVLF